MGHHALHFDVAQWAAGSSPPASFPARSPVSSHPALVDCEDGEPFLRQSLRADTTGLARVAILSRWRSVFTP